MSQSSSSINEVTQLYSFFVTLQYPQIDTFFRTKAIHYRHKILKPSPPSLVNDTICASYLAEGGREGAKYIGGVLFPS